jgi:hypothetical protein
MNMDRYWRIGGLFNSLKFISRHYYNKTVVGFVLHNSHDGATEKFKEMWEEMKNLIPEEYYKDYELLEIKLSGSYPVFMIFDTYEQGEVFIEFVEEHFDERSLAFASMWVDGVFQMEST